MKRAIAVGFVLLGWCLSATGQVPRIQREVEEHCKTLKMAKEPERKLEALAALGRISEAKLSLLKPAIPSLLEAMKDPDVNVRRGAAGLLVGLEPDPKLALPTLIAALADSEDTDVKFSAVLVLGELGKDARPALPALEALQKKQAALPPDQRNNDFFAAINETVSALLISQVQLGPWHYVGPFDNSAGKGFDAVYLPEKFPDLKREYIGKGGLRVAWREGRFTDGQVNSLALFGAEHNVNSVVYLQRSIEVERPLTLEVSLGSDDTLTVWLNGAKVVSENVSRGAAADQNKALLRLKAGKNDLLLKICQGDGDWAFYFKPTQVLP